MTADKGVYGELVQLFPCQRGKVLRVPFQTSPSLTDQEDPPSCYFLVSS